MKRAAVLALPLAALLVALLPPPAQAKPKTQLIPNATVKSVSTTSVVVTSLGKDSAFSVDSMTRVVGKGIGTKSRAKGNKPSIVDLLKEGDRVTVTYHDVGGTLHATKIEVAAK